MEERLKKQLEFILEADKSKFIGRQTYLSDGIRKENDAEHSWHLALMTALLSEYLKLSLCISYCCACSACLQACREVQTIYMSALMFLPSSLLH